MSDTPMKIVKFEADNMAIIKSMAKDQDYQVWIERVGDGDGIGFIIEDGEVI